MEVYCAPARSTPGGSADSPNSVSDWGSGGFFKGSSGGFSPMLACRPDRFCLKNHWKINVFGRGTAAGRQDTAGGPPAHSRSLYSL